MSTDVTPHVEAPLTRRVGMEIKVVMLRASISQRQLAARLDVSQTWISTRLNGITPMDLDDLDRIARALHVSLVDLLPRDLTLVQSVDHILAAAPSCAPDVRSSPVGGTHRRPKMRNMIVPALTARLIAA